MDIVYRVGSDRVEERVYSSPLWADRRYQDLKQWGHEGIFYQYLAGEWRDVEQIRGES